MASPVKWSVSSLSPPGSHHSEQSAGEAPCVGADLQGADHIPKKDINLPRVFGLEQRLC